MAESSVLRRSFSNPSESCFQEGDPLRALGESVSFGRYVSESLAWEKWSTFSHNRYLEEAEKYSKPGSVAKMKAYFEAHYKKIGARKQAAQEQVNEALNSEPEVQANINDSPSIVHESLVNHEPSSETEVLANINDSPSLHLGAEQARSHSTVYESPENDEPSGKPKIHGSINDSPPLHLRAVEASSHSSVRESPVMKTTDVELPANEVVSISGSSTDTMELQNREMNVEDTEMTQDTMERPAEATVYQCEDPEINLNVSESASEMTMIQSSDVQQSAISVEIPEIKLHVKEEEEKENLDSKNKQKSAISSVKKSTKSNMSKLSSSLARLTAPIRSGKESIGTPKSRKSAKEPLEEKKPASKLLHMSINPDGDLIKKASPAIHETRMQKVFTPLGKMIRDRFATSPAPNRTSVKSVTQQLSATPHAETRRARIALEKSFDKRRTLDRKLQSPSVGNTKPSMRSPAPTVFASFNFRTEERAAKRKELFQKRLEKEAENMQLLDKAKQVKPKADNRKSCVNLKGNPTEDVRTEVLSNNTKKIPPRRTESPKRRCKPAGELAPGACSQPPKSSIVSKPDAEKTKPIPTQSSTQLTKKTRHKNASPDIL